MNGLSEAKIGNARTEARNELLADLNPQQQEAVTHQGGPLLILAGAGSGKTRVLTRRVAWLVRVEGVPAWRILAITFTNKAAREMQERLEALLGEEARDLWVGTFHAVCARVLRREADRAGLPPSFTILDDDDQRTVIRQILRRLDLSERRWPPAGVRAAISRAKNELLGPEAFARQARSFHERQVAEVYRQYQQALEQDGALDFDDLLVKTVELLERDEEVRRRYADRFLEVLVDEYQDTNRAQYRIVRALTRDRGRLLVVGDSDQSIYGWRGADIRNILQFEEDFPDARVVKLEQNYRSTQPILDAATRVIEHNRQRKPKELWTRTPGGAPVTLYHALDEGEEAGFVVREARRLHREGLAAEGGPSEPVPWGEMAVLYRTHAQSRPVEEALLAAGIPYTVVGGLRFYERKEIRDLVAYLRLIVNPEDRASFQRVVNVPRRGIGAQTVQRVLELSQGAGLERTLRDEARLEALGAAARRRLEAFAGLMDELRARARQLSLFEICQEVLERTGYRQALEEDESIEATTRRENLDEFLTVAREYDLALRGPRARGERGAAAGGEAAPEAEGLARLAAFLSEIALLSEVDVAETGGDQVTLMTLHSAKGLEFRVVWLIGMEEGLFPHSRSLEEPDRLEEERRLCYVGMTRAREKLYLVHAWHRTIFGSRSDGTPSRFLGEAAGPGVVESGWSQRGAEAEPVAPRPAPGSSPAAATEWSPGDRLRHRAWGEGTVVEVRGKGEEQELTVAFPEAGLRRLLARYAPVERLERQNGS
ncbi:MAG: UvrD-helicase domain-containing protein [Bacillota bacterium]|nr:UvrD-helicase domain-containing protein [Bacillota bacterium]MDI3299535.1 UvrD-helicase domain-containing protein [Bacillota bacterium]